MFKAVSKAKRQGLYAELQIATIKLKLGHFREAKVALREILQEDPKVTWVVEFSREEYKIIRYIFGIKINILKEDYCIL